MFDYQLDCVEMSVLILMRCLLHSLAFEQWVPCCWCCFEKHRGYSFGGWTALEVNWEVLLFPVCSFCLLLRVQLCTFSCYSSF